MVMRRLWIEFGQQGKGYTETDYRRLVEETAGASFVNLWNTYFYQSADYTDILNESLEYIGFQMNRYESPKIHEDKFGFKLTEQNGSTRVTEVYYNSPAEVCGLAVGDEITGIHTEERGGLDPIPVRADLNEWMRYFNAETVVLVVNSGGSQKFLTVRADNEHYYPVYKVSRRKDLKDSSKQAFQNWCGLKIG
jgi:predicted metalloprotease with PDZ domain